VHSTVTTLPALHVVLCRAMTVVAKPALGVVTGAARFHAASLSSRQRRTDTALQGHTAIIYTMRDSTALGAVVPSVIIPPAPS